MHIQLIMLILIIAFIIGCCYFIISWPRKLEKQHYDSRKPPSVTFEKQPRATGVAEADEFLLKCRGFIKEAALLSVGIKDQKLLDETNDVIAAGKQICEFIEKRPSNARQVSKIVEYYFPTAIKLLGIYNDISRQRVKVKQMNETMEEIETTMDIILKAFHKHISGLYEQKAIDVNSEIEVLKHMAKMEGLMEEK